ncbi:MAG: hypothetical protein P1V97_05560 [Planctomycetota bacterium]|nr:hypothetical protein [Planctomycetota bacterium]
MNFDLGVVYLFDEEYFVAVSDETFVTVRNQRIVSVVSIKSARPRYHLTTGQLCKIWRCPPSILDDIMRDYLMAGFEPESKSKRPFERQFKTLLTLTPQRLAG